MISHFPKNGIDCADLHWMHHLPSLRNSFNVCGVSLAAAGEKTGCFFLPKKLKILLGGGDLANGSTMVVRVLDVGRFFFFK